MSDRRPPDLPVVEAPFDQPECPRFHADEAARSVPDARSAGAWQRAALAPVAEPSLSPSRLTKPDFEIDLQRSRVTCPRGHRFALGPSAGGGRHWASFPRLLCARYSAASCSMDAEGLRQVVLVDAREDLRPERRAGARARRRPTRPGLKRRLIRLALPSTNRVPRCGRHNR
jgi:hypothetical protein